MSSIDPLDKRIKRNIWRTIQAIIAIVPYVSNGIRVWYGGARTGDIGGPLVKVQRLSAHFPQSYIGYSVVYTLSNTPYLSKLAFKILKFRSIPVVLNQNGVFYSGWFGRGWENKNKEMSISWINADYAFCQSHFCYECASRFLGERKKPTEILYNAVDLNFFLPPQRKPEATHSLPVFLLTGKIDSHMFYRVEATILGFAEARKRGLTARLQISGWMSEEANTKSNALINKLNLNDLVQLTGPYTQTEAPSIYQAADVYVMMKHNDPCPNTVIEALACGLPVLYSASGGVPELVPDDAGIGLRVKRSFDQVHTPTTDSIAEGMLNILADLRTRSIAARRQAEASFDLNHWVARHEQVFESLTRKNKPNDENNGTT